MSRIAGAVAALCLAFGGLAGCSESSDSPPVTTAAAPLMPDVRSIGPAVAALEAELGGPQQYYEINADSQVVNLFVRVVDAAGAASAVRHSYVGGTLSPVPETLGTAEGQTFDATALGFDPETILDRVRSELRATDLARFVIIGAGDGSVQYSVDGVSTAGGQLRVVIGADGGVLEIDPT